MNERDFEQLLQQAKELHNPPPEVPHQRMWDKIQEGGSAQSSSSTQGSNRRLWQPALAMAAVLVLGIGLGRWTKPEPIIEPVAVQKTVNSSHVSEIYQHTTLALFDRADALLTDFRLEGCSSEQITVTSRWANNLLTQTRVLQGSPAAQNEELATLLTDLELVLAQIITINPDQCDRDVAWIRSGLNKRATLDRMRSASARGDRLAPL